MNIEPTTHAPPVLLFTWASLSFTCVLARASQQFIMFLPDGTPVRARLQVVFNEFRNVDLEAKEVKRETADYTKSYMVNQGETLSGIAARKLWRPARCGASSRWQTTSTVRARSRPGKQLLLPKLPYRDPDSGVVYG